MKETRNRILTLVFMSFYVALAIVLSYLNKIFPIIQMPNGGSLELLVIAIFMASYHLGWRKGVIVALLSWVIGIMFGLNNYFVSFPQILFDYTFPICVLGLASIFSSIKIGRFSLNNLYTGITATMFLKYSSHVLAGAYFWFPEGEAAGSIPAWIYSAWTYNLGYNLITWLAAILIVPTLVKTIKKSNGIHFEGLK